MPSQIQILAFAVYELRLLLAKHLGTSSGASPELRCAAHLAYALHNQALAVLEGKSFEPGAAIEAIAHVDKLCGENFTRRLMSNWPDIVQSGQPPLSQGT
jgi:hypothetical protein